MNKSERGRLGGLIGGKIEAEKAVRRKEAWQANPKLCKYCNSAISYDKRRTNFCSHSCAASFTNKGRRIFPIKQCRGCSTRISNSSKTFCSSICRNTSKLQNDKIAFDSGLMKDGKAKKYLIALYGEKCMECNWDKRNLTSRKVPIDLEHIDGNHENNNPTNLKLLCPNCHSLTPTYKGLNKGRGRASRRIRKDTL